MSIHLLECAAKLRGLNPSTKLALMCFADSAPLDTRIGKPGLEAVMTWAGVEKSQASDIVRELTGKGLLRKHAAGHRGRRAEYVVMPNGCCAEHPMPVDERDDEAPGWPEPSAEKGSGAPESMSVTAPGTPDPFQPAPGQTVEAPGTPDPVATKAPGKGPAHRTPSLTPTTSTTGGGDLTGPRAGAPAAARRDQHGPTDPFCDRHPTGTPDPCPVCASRRGAFDAAELRRAAARRRARSDEEIQAARRDKAAAAHVDAHAQAAAARRLLAEAKSGGVDA